MANEFPRDPSQTDPCWSCRSGSHRHLVPSERRLQFVAARKRTPDIQRWWEGLPHQCCLSPQRGRRKEAAPRTTPLVRERVAKQSLPQQGGSRHDRRPRQRSDHRSAERYPPDELRPIHTADEESGDLGPNLKDLWYRIEGEHFAHACSPLCQNGDEVRSRTSWRALHEAKLEELARRPDSPKWRTRECDASRSDCRTERTKALPAPKKKYQALNQSPLETSLPPESTHLPGTTPGREDREQTGMLKKLRTLAYGAHSIHPQS